MVGKGWGWAVGFFQVVAVVSTLTSRRRVSTEALEAIDQAPAENGLVVVLVTGRIGVELAAEFPDIADHFDALVLENGAVAVTDGRPHELAAPVDRVLDDALAERGVPFRRGEVLLAIDVEHAATVVDVIGILGLDCRDRAKPRRRDGAARGRHEGHWAGHGTHRNESLATQHGRGRGRRERPVAVRHG